MVSFDGRYRPGRFSSNLARRIISSWQICSRYGSGANVQGRCSYLSSVPFPCGLSSSSCHCGPSSMLAQLRICVSQGAVGKASSVESTISSGVKKRCVHCCSAPAKAATPDSSPDPCGNGGCSASGNPRNPGASWHPAARSVIGDSRGPYIPASLASCLGTCGCEVSSKRPTAVSCG